MTKRICYHIMYNIAHKICRYSIDRKYRNFSREARRVLPSIWKYFRRSVPEKLGPISIFRRTSANLSRTFKEPPANLPRSFQKPFWKKIRKSKTQIFSKVPTLLANTVPMINKARLKRFCFSLANNRNIETKKHTKTTSI